MANFGLSIIQGRILGFLLSICIHVLLGFLELLPVFLLWYSVLCLSIPFNLTIRQYTHKNQHLHAQFAHISIQYNLLVTYALIFIIILNVYSKNTTAMSYNYYGIPPYQPQNFSNFSKRRTKTEYSDQNIHQSSCSLNDVNHSNVLHQIINLQTSTQSMSKASSKDKLVDKKESYTITYNKKNQNKDVTKQNHKKNQQNPHVNIGKMPSYVNVAKFMDQKNQKIQEMTHKIGQLEEQLNKTREQLQDSNHSKEQLNQAYRRISELREQVEEFRESQFLLQSKIQVLQKQKEFLSKKCSTCVSQNKELITKLNNLKEEHQNRLTQEKTVNVLKNQLILLRQQTIQYKQEEQTRSCLEEKVCVLEKKLNEYMFKCNQVQTENNNWQIKYYNIQKQYDDSKMEMHQLQINNKNLQKVIEEQKKMYTEQLEKWKTRISKMEENAKLKTENQHYGAMTMLSELEGRCNKLEISTALQEKLLDKDRQITLMRKKQKDQQRKIHEHQQLLKESHQKIVSSSAKSEYFQNQLSQQKQLNKQNHQKINQLVKQNNLNAQKISQSNMTAKESQSYIKKLKQKCVEMIQQNQRISQISQKFHRQFINETQNLKAQISKLKLQITSHLQNVEYLTNEVYQKDHKIKCLMSQFEVQKQKHAFQCKSLQMRNKQHMTKQQQLNTAYHQLQKIISQKDGEYGQLKKSEQSRNAQIVQLKQTLNMKNIKINQLNCELMTNRSELQKMSLRLAQTKTETQQFQKSSEQSSQKLMQTVNELTYKLEQECYQVRELNNQIYQLQKICNEQIIKVTSLSNINIKLTQQIQEQKLITSKINHELKDKICQFQNLKNLNDKMGTIVINLANKINDLESLQVFHQTNLKNNSNTYTLQISQLSQKITKLLTQLRQKQSSLTKLTQSHKQQLSQLKQTNDKNKKQIQNENKQKYKKYQQQIEQLQIIISNLKISQTQFCNKYQQIILINQNKNKTIGELENIVNKNKDVDVSFLKSQVDNQKENNKRLKQFNAKLNQQYEQISEKYIKSYKELQLQQCRGQEMKETIRKLEERLRAQQSLTEKLTDKIQEVGRTSLRKAKQEIIHHQRTHLQDKLQLEENVKFLSEELRILQRKLESTNKQNSILRAQLQKCKKECRTAMIGMRPEHESNGRIGMLSKYSKGKQTTKQNSNYKDLQRQVEKYKLQASILKQQNIVLQETMNAQLLKRKQIIESLITEKKILYEQISTTSFVK